MFLSSNYCMTDHRLLSEILFITIMYMMTQHTAFMWVHGMVLLDIICSLYTCTWVSSYINMLFVCLFWTFYYLSDSNSLQMCLDLCRTHQSMKIRQLPWSSGLQPNESVRGGNQHQVTLHTTRLPLCSQLCCQLRMSHLVSMLVYPSWSFVYSHWTEILTWISHSVSSYVSITFTFILIRLPVNEASTK